MDGTRFPDPFQYTYGSRRKGRPQQYLIELISPELLARAKLNTETVDQYADAMLRGERFPPLELMRTKTDGVLVVSGSHRIAAAQKARRKNISSYVAAGTREQATWLATERNKKHGVRPSREDLAKCVDAALVANPRASDRLIAGHVGVSHTTVGLVRRRLEAEGAIPKVEAREGADGRAVPSPPPDASRYTTSGFDWTKAATTPSGSDAESDHACGRIDHKPEAKNRDSSQPRPISAVPQRAEVRAPGPPPGGFQRLVSVGPDMTAGRVAQVLREVFSDDRLLDIACELSGDESPRPRTQEGRTVDRFGTPILREHTQSDFERAGELLALASRVRRMKGIALKAIHANDALYGWMHHVDVTLSCDKLRHLFSSNVPYAVCPGCGGEGCRHCKNRGWVPKRAFNITPPEFRPAASST